MIFVIYVIDLILKQIMIQKFKRINKITVQTVYSGCPDPTKTLPKHPYHPIKPNNITQMKSLLENRSLKKLK